MIEKTIELAKDLRKLGNIKVKLDEWKNEVDLYFLLDLNALALKLQMNKKQKDNSVIRAINNNLKRLHKIYCVI